VEKPANTSVLLPIWWKSLALVYLAMSPVTVNVGVRAGSLGMDDALRNALPIELGHLLEEEIVFRQDRAPGTSVRVRPRQASCV
jgi:hypothetical protein